MNKEKTLEEIFEGINNEQRKNVNKFTLYFDKTQKCYRFGETKKE